MRNKIDNLMLKQCNLSIIVASECKKDIILSIKWWRNERSKFIIVKYLGQYQEKNSK